MGRSSGLHEQQFLAKMIIARVGSPVRVKRRGRIAEPVAGQTEYRFIDYDDGYLASGNGAARRVAHLDCYSSFAARLKRLIARRRLRQ